MCEACRKGLVFLFCVWWEAWQEPQPCWWGWCSNASMGIVACPPLMMLMTLVPPCAVTVAVVVAAVAVACEL